MPKIELPKIEVPKVALTSIDLPDVPVPAAAAKPLYAGVGVTDLAVEKVKEYVAEVQTKLKDLEVPQPKTLQDKATAQIADTRARFEARLTDLQAEAKALPKKVQDRYDENVATVTKQYADLAKRGESIVIKIRKGDEVKAPATIPGSVAKAAPAKKTPAKKAPSRKPAANRSPAKKSAAKNSAS